MKISSLPRLLRIHNSFMGSLSVIISAWLFTHDILTIINGMLAYIFLASAGNVINDIYDIEVDKINRPERPLPSGAVSLMEAKIIFYVLVFLGIVSSLISSWLITNFWPFLIAIIFAIIGVLYSSKLKIMGFIGNVTVGCSFSIGYIYGWTITGMKYDLPKITTILLFFIVSTTLLIAREIIKGIEDIRGDALRAVRTLARSKGIQFASRTAAAFLAIAITAFSILPLIGVVSIYFIPFMIIGDVAAFLSLVYSLKGFESASKASFYAKVGAFTGLVGFLVGVVLQ